MTNMRTIERSHRPSATADAVIDAVSYEGVLAFCREHQCLDQLAELVRLAAQCFEAAAIKLTPQSDPETREDWIELAVDARGSVQQLMEAEHRFTLRLRNEIPDRMRNHVRLYLTSIED